MKIIILTGRFGMGHYAAAQTLAERISLQPEVEVKISDVYELAFPEHYDMIYKFYSSIMEKGAKIYNFAYKKLVKQNEDSPLCLHMAKMFEEFMEKEKPDMMIATYSLGAQIVSEYKCKHGIDIPLITCITDIKPHSMWINEGTDIYLAASKATENELIQNGVKKETIYISGIPVSQRFDSQGKKKLSKRKELLVMGGGLGMIPSNLSFYKKLDSICGLHTTVITAKNKKLYKKLKGKFRNIKVVGFTENIPEYMKKSDAVVTKPGGITTFEAIEAELPMIVFKPTLEQEISNGEFICENRLGVVLDNKYDQATKELFHIESFLFDEEKLREIKAAMSEIKKTIDKDVFIEIVNYGREKSEKRVWAS